MPIIPNTRGEMIDLSTGEVVGRAEGAPTSTVDPMSGQGPDIQKTGTVPLSLGPVTANVPRAPWDLVKQASWGFNAALFALPDAAVSAIGKKLGMEEKDIPNFTKAFNRGEVAPENAPERYARALAGGAASVLPFTGVTAAVARMMPMAQVTRGGAGIIEGIANDTLRFVQQSPKLAAALDVAFGSAHDGLRQAVEENVDPNDPYKSVYKDVLPTAALVGGPLAASKLFGMTPTGMLTRAATEKYKELNAGLGEVEQEILSQIRPGMLRMPVINILPKTILKNAEKKLAQSLGPIAESKESQEAMAFLKQSLEDYPGLAQLGFEFGLAEQTMNPGILSKKAEVMSKLSSNDLSHYVAQNNRNFVRLEQMVDSFSPQVRLPIQQAFQQTLEQRKSLFDGFIRQQEGLTEAEIAAISERLGPQNMDMLNDEVRGSLLSRMEMSYNQRKQILDRFNLGQATGSDGVPLSTRDKDGKSLFDAADMNKAAVDLVNKYDINRPSMRTPLPEPIQNLKNFLQSQQAKQETVVASSEKQLLGDTIQKQLEQPSLKEAMTQAEIGSTFANASKGGGKKTSMQTRMLNAARLIMQYEKDPKKLSPKQLRSVESELELTPAVQKETGNYRLFVGGGSDYVTINPRQIIADAKLLGDESSRVDINLPEAMDYLQSAMRARNNALLDYNKALKSGRTRLTDAETILNKGNAVYNDIEKLILDHVPTINKNYAPIKEVIAGYRQDFQQSLPLLAAERSPLGNFLTPNEQLLQKAFKSADGIRQLTTVLGNDVEAEVMVGKAASDWLRSKNVVDKNGLVDPKKIQQVLDKNRNIVEALPEGVQRGLKNHVQAAEEYVWRMGEIADRKAAIADDELDSLLNKAARAGALPEDTLGAAIKDPAVMTKLVNAMEKNPEWLGSLRRMVFDKAKEGLQQGVSLSSVIEKNKPAMEVLFKDTKHLDNLRLLADYQKRVEAFADITGKPPSFESTDDALRRVFGTGIQFASTTLRETMVGRISPQTGAIAFMLRMFSSTEKQIYDKLFVRALEDPKFAERITHLSTPEQGKQLAVELQNMGIPISMIMRPLGMVGARELQEGREIPTGVDKNLPVMRQPTAKEMMRTMPPAPPTTYKPQLRAPASPSPQSMSSPQIPLMYPAMFPNDPISALLKQRQAQITGQQQPPQ